MSFNVTSTGLHHMSEQCLSTKYLHKSHNNEHQAVVMYTIYSTFMYRVFQKSSPSKTFWEYFHFCSVFLREILHICWPHLLAIHIHIYLPVFVNLS